MELTKILGFRCLVKRAPGMYGRTIVVLVSQNGKHLSYPVVVVVALLFYVHGKHLRSYRDCQLT